MGALARAADVVDGLSRRLVDLDRRSATSRHVSLTSLRRPPLRRRGGDVHPYRSGGTDGPSEWSRARARVGRPVGSPSLAAADGGCHPSVARASQRFGVDDGRRASTAPDRLPRRRVRRGRGRRRPLALGSRPLRDLRLRRNPARAGARSCSRARARVVANQAGSRRGARASRGRATGGRTRPRGARAERRDPGARLPPLPDPPHGRGRR